MIVTAIDYSVNCPSICNLNTDTEESFWAVNYRKFDGNDYPNIDPAVKFTRSKTEDSMKRFIELRIWAIDWLLFIIPDIILIEDYSFNAKGNITQLAENTGILKAALQDNFPTVPVHLVAPTKIKKFATSKGTATKDQMWEAFIKLYPTRAEWATKCHPKAKTVGSPCNDIADSFFLAQYGRTFTNSTI
jgi:hypothetical protein